MKTRRIVLLILSMVVALSGCGKDLATGSSLNVAKSKKPRLTSPNVSEADLREAVAGNNGFAFDLYQVLRKNEGNLLFSPYSLSSALAMAYAGGRGETEQEMAKTVHFTLPQDQLHPARNALSLKIASRSQTTQEQEKKGEEKGFRLVVAQAVWGITSSDVSQATEFQAPYLDTLAEQYGAGVRYLKKRAPAESRDIVNQWTDVESKGKITSIVPPGAIVAQTTMLLSDAAYFRAAWLSPFDPAKTHDGVFNALQGGQVTVPIMEQAGQFGYTKGDGFEAVELSYDGGEAAMILLLPAAGQFEAFASSLTAEKADAIVQAIKPQALQLTMPKLDFESYHRLKQALSGMGMPVAFGDADFSGMNGTRSLFLNDVYHESLVSVTETGTEGVVAAPAAEAAVSSPTQVAVDRPFIFLIRDIETGVLLFVGHVVDPSA